MYEASAIEEFTSRTGKKVKQCGLFVLPELYYLGASPDGLVMDEDAIIEVKCAFAAKEKKIIPENINAKTFSFLEYDGTKIQLKRGHSYFYQIQGQLMISRRQKCYFVVHTMCDLFIEEITFDWSFFLKNMLPQLDNFYEKVYLPFVASEIIKPK